MIILEIIKFVCLFIGIWFTIVYVGRLKYEQEISTFISFIQSLSIAGFIYLQFLM